MYVIGITFCPQTITNQVIPDPGKATEALSS